MSVITLVVILCFLAGVAWLVNTKMPGGATIKLIINIVLVVVAVVIALSAFGIWDEVKNVKVPKL